MKVTARVRFRDNVRVRVRVRVRVGVRVRFRRIDPNEPTRYNEPTKKYTNPITSYKRLNMTDQGLMLGVGGYRLHSRRQQGHSYT